MPTPVSTFSPLTPFTPVQNSQGGGSGGYFDRPAVSNMGIPSHLTRRPGLCQRNSSNSSRVSRLSCTSHDGTRQPSENGWRMAFRMRDEAWSAWEQQLGRSSTKVNSNMNLSAGTLRFSSKNNPTYTPNLGENQSDIRRPTAKECSSKTSKSPRPILQLIVPPPAPGMLRSADPTQPDRPPKLEKMSKSFDPSCPGWNQVRRQEISIHSFS